MRSPFASPSVFSGRQRRKVMFTELQKERCRAVTIISAVPTTICAFAGRHKNPPPNTTVEHRRHLTCHCGFYRRLGVGFPLILRRYTITWELSEEWALNGKACWTFTSPLSIVSLHWSLSGKLWPGSASLKLTYLIPASSWKFSMKNRKSDFFLKYHFITRNQIHTPIFKPKKSLIQCLQSH